MFICQSFKVVIGIIALIVSTQMFAERANINKVEVDLSEERGNGLKRQKYNIKLDNARVMYNVSQEAGGPKAVAKKYGDARLGLILNSNGYHGWNPWQFLEVSFDSTLNYEKMFNMYPATVSMLKDSDDCKMVELAFPLENPENENFQKSILKIAQFRDYRNWVFVELDIPKNYVKNIYWIKPSAYVGSTKKDINRVRHLKTEEQETVISEDNQNKTIPVKTSAGAVMMYNKGADLNDVCLMVFDTEQFTLVQQRSNVATGFWMYPNKEKTKFNYAFYFDDKRPPEIVGAIFFGSQEAKVREFMKSIEWN